MWNWNGGADLEAVTQAIAIDPLFLGEETQVFPVESVANLTQEGRGIMLSRRATAGRDIDIHDTLLLEGRFDIHAFSARIMLDAARRLPFSKPGARLYSVQI